MHHVSAVHMLESTAQLREVAPYRFLAQEPPLSLAMAEKLGEITSVGQLQDNVQFAAFHERVDVAHDIRMMELLRNS